MIVIENIKHDEYRKVYALAGEIDGIEQHAEHVYKIMSDHFGSTFFIAKVPDKEGTLKATGFMMGYMSQEIRGHLFVWQIAVSDQSKGQGIGHRLLKHTVCFAHSKYGCTAVMATVETGNIPSQNLFEKLDFKIESSRFVQPGQELITHEDKQAVRNYYGSGTDQIFYVLNVPNMQSKGN